MWGTTARPRKLKIHKRIVLELYTKTQGPRFGISAPVGRGSCGGPQPGPENWKSIRESYWNCILKHRGPDLGFQLLPARPYVEISARILSTPLLMRILVREQDFCKGDGHESVPRWILSTPLLMRIVVREQDFCKRDGHENVPKWILSTPHLMKIVVRKQWKWSP